ncbi:5-oxoprolinase subunit PxpB [Urechidicola sp. KH5]
MNKYNLEYKSLGESALLIEWPQQISEVILNDIRLLHQQLKATSIVGIKDINFVYHAMLVVYDRAYFNKENLISHIQNIYTELNSETLEQSKTWNIPVCYDFGLDLSFVLQEKNMSRESFIQLHTEPLYKVFGVGFLPGFLYLGGLQKQLEIARKQTPKLDVFEGAVAIGGNQTGIYPQESPGGWHIVGKTPVRLFDSSKENPTFIAPGDQVKFYAVSEARYKVLEIEISTGIYNYNSGI